PSTSCRRRSFSRGARSSRRRVPACRAGRITCSSCSPGSPTTPPTISRFRPGGWRRWAPRSRFDAVPPVRKSSARLLIPGARRATCLLRRWRRAGNEEEVPMSTQLGRENVREPAPEEVAGGLAEGKVLLVDVREPSETEVERYPEAFYLPMSQFDPAAIPDPQGRRVVFACRSGNRSVTASLMAQAAGLPYDAH